MYHTVYKTNMDKIDVYVYESNVDEHFSEIEQVAEYLSEYKVNGIAWSSYNRQYANGQTKLIYVYKGQSVLVVLGGDSGDLLETVLDSIKIDD